jgi:hypothetical protein
MSLWKKLTMSATAAFRSLLLKLVPTGKQPTSAGGGQGILKVPQEQVFFLL